VAGASRPASAKLGLASGGLLFAVAVATIVAIRAYEGR
jgi:hypothetical protein